MGNRIFTLILVTVTGVLLGLAIAVQQARQPLLHELLAQQKEILKTQSRIEKKLAGTGHITAAPSQEEGLSADVEGRDLAAVLNKLQTLEQRLAAMESQSKGMQNAFQQAIKAGPRRDGPPPEDYTKVHEIEIGRSPVRGSLEAPVTIVEFVDFQCPFCARFHGPLMEVLQAYPSEVKYVLKNFPLSFHQQARPAAKAAFAAGEQGKYWEMADALLENGKALNEDKFKELARQIGLDTEKFWKDYTEKDAQWDAAIEEDFAVGEKVSVGGTPTFYINGRRTMARDLQGFKKEIDEILKR